MIENDENLEIGILNEVIEEVLRCLKEFEKNLDFTNPDITSASIAKKINTNTNYLGRIIKYYYGKNFRSHINNSRKF